ncbi:MAG: alpha/beta fold hydrolase [Candidatus Krumholzibacteria bacterium]|nr:alpha/beta fold hydrolase [Candidatus Krumholzibacteria bacterium]
MRRALLAAVLVLFAADCRALTGGVERREEGNLVIEGIPEIPRRIEERMIQYQNTRSAAVQDWSLDGSGLYISTRFGETSQIHFVGAPGGARRQITFFDEPVYGAAVCPAPSSNGFLFGKDVGGGEFYQLFWFDVPTGRYAMLTDGASRNGGAVWSNAGDRFVYYTTRRNGRDWDLWVMPAGDPDGARPVLEAGGTWGAVDWSPDDTKILVTRYISAAESHPHLLDPATGSLEAINPTGGPASYGGGIFSKDGGSLYFTSDENSEFSHLRLYDIAGKRAAILTEEIPWDIEGISLSHDGATLAFTANEDGIDRLYLMDAGTHEYRRVEGIPEGSIGGLLFSPDDERLALTIGTPSSTGDAWVLGLGDLSLERWTFSEIGGLDPETFSKPRLIRYETFDTVGAKPRTIPAFYFRPAEGDGPFPVLIDIHGGPEGQYTPYFSATMQYFIDELGCAVIAPNVRGSTGYGKSYQLLDNGMKREDSVRDIGALLDWIERQPELDRDRVCVYGGSYGGYMVYAAMIRYNDRLRCGVDVVGISNFVTFLENTQDYRRDLRRVEYGDERDPGMREFLLKISPTANASKITRPMFIVQGLNDPRVPASEAEQMLAAIRANGGEAWYLLARDEGHGFRKKSNRDYLTYAMVLFLEEHLLR